MSSKFLQVFGCTIDVAVDGVGAVERMNLEKYDLVLKYGECFRGRRGNGVGAGLIFVVCSDRIS
jgi:osomolarity two-component system response regulator SKN7